ncbi:MAG: ribosome maturation factor RimM [Pseudanabaenaceae cyanobacterium]
MTATTEIVIIGKIVSPQGIKGELRVVSFSDFPERFTQGGQRLLLKDETAVPQPVEIISGYCLKSNVFIVKVAGVTNRNQAELLRNYLLAVPKTDRPALAEDEFLFPDLIDCVVIHQSTQQTIGTVTAVLESGNYLLEISGGGGVGLVPFVKAIVPVVDIVQKRIIIDPPAGLIDHLLNDLRSG